MKKNKKGENYLERVPVRKNFEWSADDKGIVTISIENKGIFNRIAQKLFKKPKVSYIHLEELGSFVWNQIDGHKDIVQLGKEVEEHFGEKAQPVYERLAKYVQMLDNCGFIEFK